MATTTGKTSKATSTTPAKEIQTPEAQRDVVAAISVRADGKPDQTPGYVVIGDEAAAKVDDDARAEGKTQD
jgi:hypothetical protein